MLDKKIKKIESMLLLIVIFQIFLLVNMSTAESYLIHQTEELTENSEPINKKGYSNLINKTLNLLIKIISIKQIRSVSAKIEIPEIPGIYEKENFSISYERFNFSVNSLSWNCCLKTKIGAICQDLGSVYVNDCAVDTIPTKCEQISQCELGCCIDSKEGLCSTKSPKKACESNGGNWSDEENCLIEQCVKGCCGLGNQIDFMTEKRCEKISLDYGFKKEFQRGNQLDCIALGASQIEGACVFKNEICSLKTESECLSKNGEFFQDYLCSHPDITNLGVKCEKQKSISCIEGKDEIYWLDSCGNRENIYSFDKDTSWNNGKILKKENACNPNSGNIESETCGNCNRFLSSICTSSSKNEGKGVNDGNYICKDLTCIDEKGNIRQNGESWCAYDSYIGDGKDTVGSRHWKRMCIDGEVQVEPCLDYRAQICTQSTIEESGKKFSIASCVMNEAVRCFEYNSQNGPTEQCAKNEHCMIKNVYVAENFKFDMCVGKYPRGFDLTREERAETSEQLCKFANQECTVVYQKDWKGKWNCKTNCECKTKKFAEQLNDLCISLGDCGSYVNYAGEGTNNIVVSGAPSVSWTEYTQYAKPVDGQYVKTNDASEFYAAMGIKIGTGNEEESGIDNVIKTLGTISGATGTLLYLTTQKTLLLSYVIPYGQAASSVFSAFGAAAIGFAIGSVVGGMLAKWMGRSGSAATVLTLAGGVIGATAFLMYFKLLSALSWGPYAIIIAIIVIIWTWLIGWGKTKTETVKFTCLPWQAPVGKAECKKCNEDSLKPCTEYRCSALGQVCKLLNQDTENPVCESIPYDLNPPVITPGIIIDIENISLFEPIKENPDYEFQNPETKKVEIKAVNRQDGCIPEWTLVPFTLDTNEYAQCKYNFQKTSPNYKEMEGDYPLEQTRFTLNHTFGIFMPSLDSLEIYNITGDVRQVFGNMNMYVRCQDAWENFNIDEYVVNFCITTGPDLTPARINNYAPADSSYLKYGTTETPATAYLKEPAECKYDVVEGKSYNDMPNTMLCERDVFTPSIYGWTCNTTLTNLVSGENKFYIKCKDQPWLLVENDSQRNINTEDFVYNLYVSESELKIDSITPSGIIEAGFEPISVDLEVETSGGAKNGEATCYYSFLGYDNMIQFFDTFSTKHKQNFNMMMRGDYIIYAKCEDEAGNIASKETNFELIVDSSPPAVARVYKEGGYLKLITNKDAKCYYDFYTCGFEINNATSMTTALSKSHTAQWKTGKTYYIKCVDIWGNKNDGCAIKVSPNYFG